MIKYLLNYIFINYFPKKIIRECLLGKKLTYQKLSSLRESVIMEAS